MEMKRSSLISCCRLLLEVPEAEPLEPLRQTVKPEIDDGRCVKRQELAQQQTADDGDAKRMPQLRSRAAAHCQRKPGKQRCHSSHHDRAKAQQTRLKDRFLWCLVLFTLGF